MSEYRILVTDITNFGGLRCIAGWDLDREKMIRPEPAPRSFWQATSVGPNSAFELGATVHFTASKPHPPTEYPHFTEDRVVAGRITKKPGPSNAPDLLRDAAFDSFDALFEENLVIDGEKAYVPVGSKCRSLGGLLINSEGATVESYRNFKNKHRLRFRFKVGAKVFAPNLTSNKAYALYAANKIGELNERIGDASELLLRIGLARKFPGVPDRCYLQVNGLSIR